MLNWMPVEFFQKGCNMTHFVKSENDAANSITLIKSHIILLSSTASYSDKVLFYNFGNFCLLNKIVTVTGKRGSNYRLSLSCNRKSKKLNLTNLFNSQ